jgi:hypothetical protein
VQDGTLTVDRYRDFHPDIFVHPNGHAVVGNNVAASVIAALPLLVFSPVLNQLEAYERARIRREGPPATEYRTADHPNSRKFYAVAANAGLTLRFGASAAVTTVCLMAPLSALMLVLMFRILIDRGVARPRALGLALLFGFGTPGVLPYRRAESQHDADVHDLRRVSSAVGAAGGAGAGESAAAGRGRLPVRARPRARLQRADPAGGRLRLPGWRAAAIGVDRDRRHRSSAVRPCGDSAGALSALQPVVDVRQSVLPGQYWMPDVSASDVYGQFRNPYSTEGFRGFSWPSISLLLATLFSPSYGMYTYGPLLLVGLVPAFMYPRDQLILPRTERLYAAALFAALVLFCASNQYSRIQFNSGFRYLVPLVPTIFLAASDHLARMPTRWLAALAAPAVLNSWIISMVREPVPESWRRVLTEGIQYPWLTVLRLTAPEGAGVLGSPALPLAIAGLASLIVFLVWRVANAGVEATPERAW